MFTLKELPYAYDALEPYIDRETMHIHHDKHHATYVKNLNDLLTNFPDFYNNSLEDVIKSAVKLPEDIRQKVINNAGGVINHDFYWEVMAPGLVKPSDKFMAIINSQFGDFEKLKEAFTNAALGRFGSGWAWLVLDNNKLKITDTANQDTKIGGLSKPVLTIDVWEHAYYLKYQNRRAEYINAWWSVVNWTQVEKLYFSLI